MPKRDTSKRRPRCLRLFCQWAAMYEVDIEIVRRDGRQQYGQLEALAWELVHGGEDEEDEEEGEGEGDDLVSRLLVAAVAAAVEECMQSKIAKALGWMTTMTTTTGQTATVFKPIQERVWPAWTKGWLRADWDGSLREPTERDKRAIARWWAATQKQQPKRCRRDEVDDGDSDAGASDVDAAAQSHSARTGQEGRRGGGGGGGRGPRREEEHRRMLLDQLLQNLYPGETDLQDDVMQALLFGIGDGDGDWTRYDWLP
ncbi:hypothetical protein IWZ03DRAFT_390409 [Phyllosticta citriasiana]|uniref:Uncharacterized protein n=1 Tax=Phyllosticta citriasiana TaxID=595635 RepID=A0ABR1KDC2_9PEZI